MVEHHRDLEARERAAVYEAARRLCTSMGSGEESSTHVEGTPATDKEELLRQAAGPVLSDTIHTAAKPICQLTCPLSPEYQEDASSVVTPAQRISGFTQCSDKVLVDDLTAPPNAVLEAKSSTATVENADKDMVAMEVNGIDAAASHYKKAILSPAFRQNSQESFGYFPPSVASQIYGNNTAQNTEEEGYGKSEEEGSRQRSKEKEPEMEPWQHQLLELFDEIDVDKSGDIRNLELRHALQQLSVVPAKSTKLLKVIDKDGNGRVERTEWNAMVRQMGQNNAPEPVREFADALFKQKAKNGRIYPKPDLISHSLILICDSPYRIGWDVLTTLFLLYIAISLPFAIGFHRFMDKSSIDTLETIEFTMDCFFMADVLLNFRTSYIAFDGSHVKDGRDICWNYLRSWFLIDFISSVPFDKLGNAIPNLQPVKLLKVGRVAKALKFMRLGRLFKRSFEIGGGFFDELVTRCQPIIKLSSLVLLTTCLCHWLACFMVASGDGFLGNLDNVEKELWSQYMAGLYWGMTTMATVGYGDILPDSDEERLYTTFAMIVGCGFYAYLLGSITSVVSTIDANMRFYHERMGLINAWLDHHTELPMALSRKVRRHFKFLLTEKTALGDASILSDLSPDLRIEVAQYIVHSDVRYNVLFEGLPSQALSLLVPIIQTTRVEVNERVVSHNEPGVAMFIILDGTALITWAHAQAWSGGNPETPSGARKTTRSTLRAKTKTLEIGDSFGEEIILGLEERYLYTVTATARMVVHMIPLDGFNECFTTVPYLVAQMQDNFLRDPNKGNKEKYRSQLRDAYIEPEMREVRGSNNEVFYDLAEEVRSSLEDLKKLLTSNMQSSAAPLERRLSLISAAFEQSGLSSQSPSLFGGKE
jgi:Ca2+-binding EF-hand superfamily protein